METGTSCLGSADAAAVQTARKRDNGGGPLSLCGWRRISPFDLLWGSNIVPLSKLQFHLATTRSPRYYNIYIFAVKFNQKNLYPSTFTKLDFL